MRCRQLLALRAERDNIAALCADRPRPRHVRDKAVRLVVQRTKHERRLPGRIGKDTEIPHGGECAFGTGTVSVIDTVTQPQDFRRAGQFHRLKRGNGVFAIGEPGRGIEHARRTFSRACREQRRVRSRGCRGQDRDSASLPRCCRQRIGDRRAVRIPVLRRRPSVVDEQDQRTIAHCRFLPTPLRLRERDDHECCGK